MVNAITVDVEDWFHVSRFRDLIKPSDWPKLESRVANNVTQVLDIFDEFEVKGTFFILAWVAQYFPELVWMIHERGHEIGSHGYSHQLIYDQSRDEFDADLKASLRLLKDILGYDVRSYRAPSFSINKKSLWVFDVLVRNGIAIDSSMFPVNHDLYGGLDTPAEFYRIPVQDFSLIECPPATIPLAGKNFPIGGGGYFRLFPMWLIEKSLNSLNEKGTPAVIYFHPWEIDFNQPRLPAGRVNSFLHYNNIEFMTQKLRHLFSRFSFSTLGQVVNSAPITLTWPKW